MLLRQIALLVQLAASQFFLQDHVRWTIDAQQATYDRATNVLIVSATPYGEDGVPYEDVGCDHARFIIDVASEEALAVYCDGVLL